MKDNMRACEMCDKPVVTRRAKLCSRACLVQFNRVKALEREALRRGDEAVTRAYSDDINEPHYWPRNLPEIERVARAREMVLDEEQPHPAWEIVAATGVTKNMVGQIRHEAWLYDPIIDEVALDRALSGDPSVLPRLTIFERAELRERLVDRLRDDPLQIGDSWMAELADRWQVDGELLRKRVTRRKQREDAA